MAEAANGLVWHWAKQGQAEEARKYSSRPSPCSAISPERSTILASLHSAGKTDDAIAAFEYRPPRGPDDDILYLNLRGCMCSGEMSTGRAN